MNPDVLLHSLTSGSVAVANPDIDLSKAINGRTTVFAEGMSVIWGGPQTGGILMFPAGAHMIYGEFGAPRPGGRRHLRHPHSLEGKERGEVVEDDAIE